MASSGSIPRSERLERAKRLHQRARYQDKLQLASNSFGGVVSEGATNAHQKTPSYSSTRSPIASNTLGLSASASFTDPRESVTIRRQRALEIVKRREMESRHGSIPTSPAATVSNSVVVHPATFETPSRKTKPRSSHYSDSFQRNIRDQPLDASQSKNVIKPKPRAQSFSTSSAPIYQQEPAKINKEEDSTQKSRFDGVVETPQRMSVASLRASFSRGSNKPVMPMNSNVTPGRYSYTPSKQPWVDKGSSEGEKRSENTEEKKEQEEKTKKPSKPWQRHSTMSTNLESWQTQSQKKSANTKFCIEIEESVSMSPPEERKSVSQSVFLQADSIKKDALLATEPKVQSPETVYSSDTKPLCQNKMEKSIETQEDENVEIYVEKNDHISPIAAKSRYDVLAAELFPAPSIEENNNASVRGEKTFPSDIMQQMSEDSSLYLEDARKDESQPSLLDKGNQLPQSEMFHNKREDPTFNVITSQLHTKFPTLRPSPKDNKAYRVVYMAESPTSLQSKEHLQSKSEDSQFESPFFKNECGSFGRSFSPQEERDEVEEFDDQSDWMGRDPGFDPDLSGFDDDFQTKLTVTQNTITSPAWIPHAEFKKPPPKEVLRDFQKRKSFDPFDDSPSIRVANSDELFASTPLADPFMTEESFSPLEWTVQRGKVLDYKTSPEWNTKMEI